MTDVGMVRKVNQDYVFTSENPVGKLPNFFMVADGMGGHNAGDYASKYATEIIVDEILANPEEDPIQIIRSAIEVANHCIREKAYCVEAYRGMGTTVVAATLIENYLYIANVGDSRLYIVNDSISQITKDHSYVEEMVRLGKIDKNEARNHPDRNMITRAVGVDGTVKIDFFEIRLQRGDIVLMCSDGLTTMLDDEEIFAVIRGQECVAGKVEGLIEAANRSGGKDNIAVVIIDPFAGEVRE